MKTVLVEIQLISVLLVTLTLL